MHFGKFDPTQTELNSTDTDQFLTNWPMGKQGEPIGYWLTRTWA